MREAPGRSSYGLLSVPIKPVSLSPGINRANCGGMVQQVHSLQNTFQHEGTPVLHVHSIRL